MLKKLELNNKNAILVLLGLIFLQMYCYNYQTILKIRPRSIHSWRQTDCLSFTLNFFNGRGTFFEPCVNNLGESSNGKVASDFPLIQYTIAQIWKITGQSEMVFRIIELLFLITGLCFIYRLFLFWTKNNYLISILSTALIFTSPILSYYGPTFLSDIQAFGLSCGGIYFFFRWLDSKKRNHLIFSILFFLFAALLKMSAFFMYSICLSTLSVIVIKSIITKNKINEYLNLKNIGLMLIPFICCFLWYSFANQYDQKYPNGFFLIGILPIWDLKYDAISNITMDLFTEILPQMLNVNILLFLLLFSLTIVITKNTISGSLNKTILLFVGLFFIAYVILFFQVFNVHDYYMINMMPVMVIALGIFLKYSLDNFPAGFRSPVVYVFLTFLVILCTYTTAIKTRGRIDFADNWGLKALVYNRQEYESMKYNTWYDRTRYEVLENNFEPKLEHLGIGKNATVLCLGDITINRSLYLMNRVGYTSFNVGLDNLSYFISEKKKNGLNYLILIEPEWLSNENLKPFLTNKIFEEKNVTVYKI